MIVDGLRWFQMIAYDLKKTVRGVLNKYIDGIFE